MASTRVRWEYRTLRPPRGETKKEAEDPQAELNDLGEEGWELAGTIEYTGGGTKFLVFKRPVETPTDATGRAETDGGTEEGTEVDSGAEQGIGADSRTEQETEADDGSEEDGPP